LTWSPSMKRSELSDEAPSQVNSIDER
jgi:hypothetical protein